MSLVMLFPSTAARLRLLAIRRLAGAAPEGSKPPRHDVVSHQVVFDGDVTSLGDRLGRAGFLGSTFRRRARKLRLLILVGAPAAVLAGITLHLPALSLRTAFVGLSFGALSGLGVWLLFLRAREREFEREVLFRLPLFLESLMLGVESGMAVLPALENVVSRRERVAKNDPVAHIFAIAYRLASHGIPLESALEMVASNLHIRALRHVLLHLDISANAGGELLPSLRNLSDHAHLEWKLSVEQRVRRLENLVVFPVFACVIGLILLTAAVPLVPLLNLQSTLAARPELRSIPIPKPQ